MIGSLHLLSCLRNKTQIGKKKDCKSSAFIYQILTHICSIFIKQKNGRALKSSTYKANLSERFFALLQEINCEKFEYVLICSRDMLLFRHSSSVSKQSAKRDRKKDFVFSEYCSLNRVLPGYSGVFRGLSNICHDAFQRKQLTQFLTKSGFTKLDMILS